ncbi:MAG: response regulator [Proteobacteria bacterium]|uniref:hybrid sensor histidine kinase/response regulator n=1 Tax=Aquabacterium sp. TaxID=1872578 RepID=UPI0035C67460|nr:response regulator [Pseudomonadota bacterium]
MGSAGAQDPQSGRLLPSAQGMALALSAARAGLWEWDVASHRNRWSDEVWGLYGLDRTTHTPSFENWQLSVHPDDRERATRSAMQAAGRGLPFELEWRTNPQFGPVRWILSRGQPAGPQSPLAQTFVGIVMDITQRKRSEQALQDLNNALAERVHERTQALDDQQRLLQTILDGVPGLVGYWDKRLHNRFANRSYLEWFGVSAEDIRGHHVRDVLGPDLYALNRPLMDAALRGERQRFMRDIPVPGQPGKVRISETHYLPDIDHGEVRGFLVMVFDVTQVTLAERQARAASEAKSEFLANISHELRTPLNAMFGLAQIGARDTAGTPSARTFQQILSSGQHLLELINDVLDFSKIEAGKMQLQANPMRIAQVLEHVVAMTALRAEAKGLHLLLTESPRVPQGAVGDATRLAQILVNLVANAIKFTEQGEVCICLDFLDGELVVEVRDTGIGIDPRQIGQLFQPFVQATGGARRQGGTGLGLAICKRLAQLMHGRIDVRSTPGQGSCFTVHVPLNQAESADFRSLGKVWLIGFPPARQARLQQSLAARHCPSQTSDALPARLGPGDVLVVHELLLPHLDTDRINRWLDEGRHVLISVRVAPSTPLCPSGVRLHEHAAIVAGPLSPLRLLNALQHPPTRSKGSTRHRLPGLRILAAEDNPVNRLILAEMLEGEGAQVQFAFDGAQAVALARKLGTDAIDIVLCDIQMPVMDGYEATRELLRLDPQLPIVGLTAHAFSQARQQAEDVGMREYVTKPYLLDTLVEVIRRHSRRPADTENDTQTHTMPGTLPEPDSDWDAMRRHFQGQTALFDRLVDVALQSLPGVLAELDRARALGDIAALAKIAHEIKGTALNLRAPNLARLGAATQDQARQQLPGSQASADELSACLSQFLDALRDHAHPGPGDTLPGGLDVLGSVNQPVRPDVAQDGRGDLLNRLVRR